VKTHTKLLGVAWLVIPFLANSLCWAAPATEYSVEKLGVRNFALGEREYKIPWYRARADYNSIETAEFWKRLHCPPETKAAYVGYYHTIEWCEWFDDQKHAQVSAQGMDFLVRENFRVNPGPGKVYVRRWLFQEQRRDEGMVFKDKRYYVFLLDRQPVEQWRTVAKKPGCDMDTDLEHLIGIIEIQPTFEFDERSSSSPLYVTRDSLLVFRQERHGCPAGYEQEYAVVRSKDGTFRCETQKAVSAPASPETVQKLLYAFNTCAWTRHNEPHTFEISPAVARTVLECKDKQGRARTVTISYDKGGWHTDRVESVYYSTGYPQLLFEVQEDIRASRGAGTENTQPSGPPVSK